jgi:hypothetical protein
VTPHEVFWPINILADMGRIWMFATDEQAITDAYDHINRSLKADPYGNGRHRSEGLYLIEAAPLAATYVVNDETRTVIIRSVLTSQ